MATTMLFISTSSRKYLKMPYCHTYRPQCNTRWSSQIRTESVTS